MKQAYHQRAVTMVELILAITLTGIVAGILGTIMLQISRTYTLAHQTADVSWQVRLALWRMERELGETTGIVTGTNTNQLRFSSGQNGSTISYGKSGTNLVRDGVALTSHVSALSFSGLDSSLATTTSISAMRCININATISYQNQTTPLSTTVCPRNLLWSA